MIKKSLLLLNHIKISPQKIQRAVSIFADPDEILKMGSGSLREKLHFKDYEIEKFFSVKNSFQIEKELEIAEKEGIEIIDIFSQDYPPFLKEIVFAPPILYVKGEREVLSQICFAIVGSRIPTVYGLSMAERFSFGLASLGIVVVSGLARGIDTQVHRSALRGGKTVAVLGSGLLNLYPKENRKLAYKISEEGALVSEFSLFEPPLRENFPRRNRIISGLSKGVLVVEASAKSGALITARYACEQNREVFALPGQANSPLSKGTNFLIREGAKLVEGIEDILEELNLDIEIEADKGKRGLSLSPQERKMLEAISEKGTHLEELILKTGLSFDMVNKTVVSLRLKGLIKERTPLHFVRTVNL
ncbi:MAG: DNA-processing protein DprA [Candidatus Omnitrophica bacterium]|nr:DNA-processing protein DprA [Candidatus Omnitrophota bacterium]